MGDSRIALTRKTPGLETDVIWGTTGGCSGDRPGEGQNYQELGTLSLGRHELVFDVSIEAFEPYTGFFFDTEYVGPPAGVLWSGELTITTEIVPNFNDALPPLANEDIDASLRSAIGVGFYQSGLDSRPAPRIVIDEREEDRKRLVGVALMMEGDLLKNGEVVETVPLEARAYDENTLKWRSRDVVDMRLAHYRFERLPAYDREAAKRLEGWSVRIRGTSKGVLGCWSADAWWSGFVEVPLSLAIENEDLRFERMPWPPWQWPD